MHEDLGNAITAIAVCVMFMIPIVIVIAVYRHRSHLATLKTLIDLAEHGTPVPFELLMGRMKPQGHEDLRLGMVLTFVGLGGLAFAFTLPNHYAWGLGLLPLFAGFGYLLTWKLGRAGDASGKDA